MKKLIAIFSLCFIISLIIFSESNNEAVIKGLDLWINNVFPSLFPFFIATEILCNTNIIYLMGKVLEKPVSKVFNVPGEGAFALIMGTISGYPTGAKIVTNLKSQNRLTLEESERLLAFTNNSGPLFIIGTVGTSLLNNTHLGYILLISHLISCILVGVIFRNWKRTNGMITKNILEIKKQENSNEYKDFGEILSDSIRNSIITIVNIGGFIVLFSVILSILNNSGFFKITGYIFQWLNITEIVGNSSLSGIIELTNGVKEIALLQLTKLNICIISFLIGFGGLSVLFQVYSIVSKENISIKPYLYGKLLQGFLSFFITAILI